MRARTVAAAALGLMALVDVQAQTPGAPPQTAGSAISAMKAAPAVFHKLRFLEQLLGDSPMVRRIESSGNGAAIGFLNAAIEHQQSALEQMRVGLLADAEKSLNDAILNAGRARQLVPENSQRAIFDRVRFARLLTGVESLRANYERHLRQRGGYVPAAIPQDEQLERVDALIEDARGLASAERLLDASRVLENAEHGLLLGLNRVLGTSVRYTERFENPSDEYAFETQRNSSYAELVPVAIHEYRPTQDALRQMSRHVERNKQLRGQADEAAGRREWRAALRTIRSATAELQRALAAAGLTMPRDGADDKNE